MAGGVGFDFVFECCGIPSCMTSALDICRKGLGVLTVVGLSEKDGKASFNPWHLLVGKTIKGTHFGGAVYFI